MRGKGDDIKYFSILGDSISTFSGYSVPEYAAYYDAARKLEAEVYSTADTWWGQVIESFGGRLLVNNSFAGSTVSYHPQYEIQSYSCSDERTFGLHKGDVSPDVIFVFMGMNDWGRGISVIPSDDTQKNDHSVFSVAYETMLCKLRNNYPDARIFCLGLPASESETSCRSGVHHITEYCDAINECAEREGCSFIDLYSSGIRYSSIDGAHPDREGMSIIADAVIKQMKL